MADLRQVQELKLDNLTLSKGQVRTKVGEGIDELAESIRVMGLLEPIVVMPSSKAGKYEILTGQRRFLAHKRLGKQTILAFVRTDTIDEHRAKGISVTENVMRPRFSQERADRFLHVAVQEIRVHPRCLRCYRAAGPHGAALR